MKIRQLLAALLPNQPAKERRSEDRIECSERVQVIQQNPVRLDNLLEISLGWMENISVNGCQLSIRGGVAADRLWIRPFNEPLNEFIECQVMWRGERLKALQPCGVQFHQVMYREELDRVLRNRVNQITT